MPTNVHSRRVAGAQLERVTVNLTPRSWSALEQTVELTGDSKTDVINRAIQVYGYLEKITQAGGQVFVHEKGQTELERVRFF